MKKNELVPVSVLLLTAMFASNAFGSGADDLMKATGNTGANSPAGAAANTANSPLAMDASEFKLQDPFALQFFSAWQTERNLPFEINAWSQQVLKGKYAAAAHLWTAIQSQMPESFANSARAAQIYCLWKLDLSQTFFNQWLDAVRSETFRQNLAAIALQQTLSPGFDHWILETGIVLTQDQKQQIVTMDSNRGFMDATIKGYAALRTGAVAIDLLPTLAADNALKIPLSETVILGLARSADLGGAAKVLKDHLEPALQAKKDPKLLATHYIEIARLLYQAGSLDGAEQYYQKVPTGVPSYLASREELMWVWLRKGDSSHLRGELTSLNSPIFSGRFSPELYLVRSISNLKLCFYDEVAKDFQAFIASNSVWAKEISDAEKAENPPPPEKDFYTLLLERSYDHLQAENGRLQKLGQESIGAALPAVGPQLHWKKASENVATVMDTVKKQRSDEYRRQWRNRQQILAEAIRKMKFVKIEYLSQLHTLASNDQIRISNAAPVSKEQAAAAQNAKISAEKAEANQEKQKLAQGNDMNFPFDGTYWADEIFKLRSVVHGQCLK